MGTFVTGNKWSKNLYRNIAKVGAGVSVIGGLSLGYYSFDIISDSVGVPKMSEIKINKYFKNNDLIVADRFSYAFRSHYFAPSAGNIFYGSSFVNLMGSKWTTFHEDTGSSMSGSLHLLKNDSRPGTYIAIVARSSDTGGGVLFSYVQLYDSTSPSVNRFGGAIFRRLDRWGVKLFLMNKRRSLCKTIDTSSFK